MLVEAFQRVEEGCKKDNLFTLFQGILNKFDGMSALSEGEFATRCH